MKQNFKIVFFLIIILLTNISPILANSLEAYLNELISRSTPDDLIQVIVQMNDRVDLSALKTSLRTNHANLAQRHETVINALKIKAETTQQDLLFYLEIEKQLGNVNSYQSMWIGNYILLTAKPAVIEQIAAREDVAKVSHDAPVGLIEPIKSYRSNARDGDDPQISNAEPGLHDINAHLLWAEGITGEGRLVANFDTGVDVTHPALEPKWRGNNGASPEAAWLGFGTASPIPVPINGDAHGTHTMGTMVGSNDATGDTVGVAYGAQWIAVGTAWNSVLSEVIAAYQWLTDPDGDPETMDDVPDVVNNSWGVNESFPGFIACDPSFNDAIDGVEAAGVVVIFAAGNEGPGSASLRSPADRIESEVSVLAVGALQPGSSNIADFSSRGPTECTLEPGQPDSLLIKPELCAQGVSVRSTVPGGGYEGNWWSGTSMAAPHVAGAVALLRQISPEATPEEIKFALINSAFDLGTPGNDNTYGFGLIDVFAASQLLGGHVEGYANMSGVDDHSGIRIWTTIENDNFAISDESGYYKISNLTEDHHTFVARHRGYYDGRVEDVFVPLGQTIEDINFNLQPVEYQPQNLVGTSELNMAVPLEWQAPEVAPSWYNLYRGTEPNGPYAQIAEMVIETQFVDIDVINGHTYFYVATAVYEDPYGESDFSIEAMAVPGERRDLPLESDFEDDEAGLYLIIINEGDGSGLWQRGTPNPEHGPGGAASGENVWASGLDENYSNSADIYLLTPLLDLTTSAQPILEFDHWYEFEGTNQRGDDGGNVAISTDAGDSWTVVEPSEPYEDPGVPGLSGEPGFSGSSNDWVHSRFDLSEYNDRVVTIRFRLGADLGINKAGWFIDNLSILDEALSVEDENEIASDKYVLYQNSPNPFNPSTTISFQIPVRQKTTVAVYNMSGQLVKILVDGLMDAGHHRLAWDGRNSSAEPVTSGVYFYILQTDSFSATKRMVMLK